MDPASLARPQDKHAGCTHPSVSSSWAALGACWAQELFRQGPVWLSPAQPALPPSHHSLRDIREALK